MNRLIPRRVGRPFVRWRGSRKGRRRLIQLARDNKLPNDVKFTATMELNQVRWPEVKAQAAKVLPAPQGRNAQALPPLRRLLQMPGDANRGSRGFPARPRSGCSTCHRINDKGGDVGPALSEIGAKLGKDAIYEAILDPSAGIAFGYEAWTNHFEIRRRRLRHHRQRDTPRRSSSRTPRRFRSTSRNRTLSAASNRRFR